MKFSFSPTFKEQYLASLIIVLSSPFSVLINLIFPLAGLFLLYLIISFENRIPSPFEFSLIFFCFGFNPILLAFTLYLARRKNKTVDGAHEYNFNEQGFKVSGMLFEISLNYSALYRILETNRYLFFYFSPRGAYYLPKYIFTSETELNELKQLLLKRTTCRNNFSKS